MTKYHKDGDIPKNGEIYVFGSNLAGRHGKGSALVAKQHFGAIYGRGTGLQGQSYAIPTKDGRLGTHRLGSSKSTLSITAIKAEVDTFIQYAVDQPDQLFYIVRIGCVLAAHTDSDIAPLFSKAPANCIFPDAWAPWLGDWEL